MSEETKEIVRQIIQFKQCGDGYNVMALMQGYTVITQNTRGCLMYDMLPLGYCKEENVKTMVEFFTAYHHDIEFVYDS